MYSKTIPLNWAKTTVGEIISFEYGKSLPKKSRDPSGSYSVYGSSGEIGTHSKYFVNEPCLIIGRKGTVGSVHLSKISCWPIDTTYFVIPPTDIDLKFLCFMLSTCNLPSLDKSTAIPGLNRNDAYNISINLPPLNEQHRIVAKIEELFTKLDAGEAALQKVKAEIKRYRQAVLKYAVNGEILVASGRIKTPFNSTIVCSLKDVVESLGQGWSPRCLKHSAKDVGKWGVIKTTAIQHLNFDESENKQLPDELEPRPHLSILPNDILVTRAGPRRRVGVACLVRECRKRLMICDKVYRLRVNKKMILPDYLELQLNSPSVIEDIEKLKTGMSDSGLNLTQDRFLKLNIFVPTLELQKQTIAEFSNKMSIIDDMTGQLGKSCKYSSLLRQSILKKAFEGKLVPQDHNDEPAEELLQRIKIEKAKLEEEIKPLRKTRKKK
jgi:type I restriction enzyme, S subunit